MMFLFEIKHSRKFTSIHEVEVKDKCCALRVVTFQYEKEINKALSVKLYKAPESYFKEYKN